MTDKLKKDGGPAFPGFAYTDGHGPARKNASGDWEYFVPGMTLRDYFAARGMHGQIGGTTWKGEYEAIAKHAYGIADAMLLERDK